MKRFLTCFLILCTLSLMAAGGGDKPFRVVIDPGHGGHDPGAPGKFLKEKDVVLDIALKLGAYINQNMPDVEVIYTRKTDVFVELHKRAQIANEIHADLFISIHCNGSKSSNPMGTETWVMGLHKSDANLEVAKKENAVILLEDDYSAQYDGFDPNSPEAYILFSFFQNANLNQSLEMARRVQDQFRERTRRVDRGVKQAGFLVLYKTTMPGILVEAGFLSNPQEEAFLASDEGKSYIASAIYRALREYREWLANKNKMQEEASRPIISEKPAQPQSEESRALPGGLEYGVQVRSSSVRLSADEPDFHGLTPLKEYLHAGAYKYYLGGLATYAEAMGVLQQIKNRGFNDAFVIALKDGRRIALTEARKESGE